MTFFDLQKIYDTVSDRIGWDFSRMKDERQPTPWDYMQIVKNYFKTTDSVLDIGTGGGEKFIKLSEHFSQGIGIDPSKGMIKVAHQNAQKNINTKVQFKLMGAEDLRFPNNTFDTIINRHAVVVPSQVAKVLKPQGYFITQQVRSDNMANLKKAFNDQRTWPNDLKTLTQKFEANNCKIIAQGSYDVSYWVKDLESLVFWLKAVDLPENFNIADHAEQLLKYIEEYSTPKGYITNESRDFLIVQKNSSI